MHYTLTKILHLERNTVYITVDKYMFRLWAKIYKDGKIQQDMVIPNDSLAINRTKKIFSAIDSVCYEFNLSKPIWLDSTIKDFQLHNKTRFTKDNFIDSIEFDFLEIEIIEED